MHVVKAWCGLAGHITWRVVWDGSKYTLYLLGLIS